MLQTTVLNIFIKQFITCNSLYRNCHCRTNRALMAICQTGNYESNKCICNYTYYLNNVLESDVFKPCTLWCTEYSTHISSRLCSCCRVHLNAISVDCITYRKFSSSSGLLRHSCWFKGSAGPEHVYPEWVILLSAANNVLGKYCYSCQCC